MIADKKKVCTKGNTLKKRKKEVYADEREVLAALIITHKQQISNTQNMKVRNVRIIFIIFFVCNF